MPLSRENESTLLQGQQKAFQLRDPSSEEDLTRRKEERALEWKKIPQGKGIGVSFFEDG